MAQRRSTRQTSVLERSNGGAYDALSTVLDGRHTQAGLGLVTLGTYLTINGDADKGWPLITAGFILLLSVVESQRRRPSNRPPLNRPDTPWRIDDFHSAEIREMFGFDSQAELHRLKNALQWPAEITVGQQIDTSKHYRVDGEQAFLFMLERHHVGSKYTAMEFRYGYSYNGTCEQALAAEKWLVDTHGHRLLNLAFFKDRFAMYAGSIRRKILSQGDDIPPEGHMLCGFLDRTSLRIAKPNGNWAFQHLFHSFKSQFHCLAYQSISAPDGMIIHLWGPKAGKHNDRLLLGESGVNKLLEDLQRLPDGSLPPEGQRFSAYTDRGYENNTCIWAAHHGILVTVQQAEYNDIMSPSRVCVEWGFSKIKNFSRLLGRLYNMQVQGNCVDVHMKAATLLVNAHTMLHGANGTKYFDCVPPSLEAYFA